MGKEDGQDSVSIVYETDRVTLYHGSSEVILPSLPKESVSLVVTDPPYGVNHSSGWREESFGEIHNDGVNDRDVVRSVLEQCVRLTQQRRHLYVFGPSDVMKDLKVSEATELIWDRGVIGQGNLSSQWGPQHEPITFAISFFRHAGKVGGSSSAVRMRKGSVLRYMRPTGRNTLHPNQKPTALLRELIESSSRQDETVLDPFSGLGSTGVAALLSGRKAILVESDERWIGPTVQRLEKAEQMWSEIKDV